MVRVILVSPKTDFAQSSSNNTQSKKATTLAPVFRGRDHFTAVSAPIMRFFVFYPCRKQNLIKPMLHGDKQLAASMPASRDDAASRVSALVIFGICAAFVVWVASLAA